ncbi:DUF1934 domain-containing protein [Vagococcus intermedius]|uniref:DUF1934 domain-containing protein n=1 Tax=Vagococcus intermedius TaxID=2991418 RepID=A0AAF0CU73_9ENTE|nr:DUF1934 domain-containing protein [Vagococcus intermedius]WEG72942.1 DUF1934 domain-containing protein [Vagococcus intermedius]WEG75028.1 DUF1934 domain-containing protein [Vagococcus intermedius]
MKNGIKVNVHLKTTITVNGEEEVHVFDVPGQVVKMAETLYLRYEEQYELETGESLKIPVTVKFEENGVVHLTRAAEQRVKMSFDLTKSQSTNYRTPYGMMLIDVVTIKAHLVLQDKPIAGEAIIDYQLKAGTEKLGDYQLDLRFAE